MKKAEEFYEEMVKLEKEEYLAKNPFCCSDCNNIIVGEFCKKRDALIEEIRKEIRKEDKEYFIEKERKIYRGGRRENEI